VREREREGSIEESVPKKRILHNRNKFLSFPPRTLLLALGFYLLRDGPPCAYSFSPRGSFSVLLARITDHHSLPQFPVKKKPRSTVLDGRYIYTYFCRTPPAKGRSTPIVTIIQFDACLLALHLPTYSSSSPPSILSLPSRWSSTSHARSTPHSISPPLSSST